MNETTRELAARFNAVLAAAMAERHRRQEWVRDEEYSGNQTLAWVLYERAIMLAAVNAERKRRGMDEVHMGDIVAVERQAVGHVDYQRKFALYCAELASAVISAG